MGSYFVTTCEFKRGAQILTTTNVREQSPMHSGEKDNYVQSLNSLSKNTSIMIIDDEEDILNLFNDFLQQQGYSVTTYNNSILALQEIEKKPQEHSLILTDIRMPGISGLELAKIVNNLNKDIKVIFMSAFQLDSNNLKGIRYHEYIQKPVHIQMLLQTVKNLLN